MKNKITNILGLEDEVVSYILDLAGRAAKILAFLLSRGDYVVTENVSNIFSQINKYSNYLDTFLQLSEMYRDKEDRYIYSILKKHSKEKSRILILLNRLDYVYTTKKQVLWGNPVCKKGWFYQKKVSVY